MKTEEREKRKGIKWKSELEETKGQNGWLAALIGKFSLSPLLVNHKGVRNDFFPSKTLLYHLLTYRLHNSLTFSRNFKVKTRNIVGRLLQLLQLVLYHFEVLNC